MKTIKRPLKNLLMGLGVIGLVIAVVGCETEEADTNYGSASSPNDTGQAGAALVAQDMVGEWFPRAVRRIPMGKVAPTM